MKNTVVVTVTTVSGKAVFRYADSRFPAFKGKLVDTTPNASGYLQESQGPGTGTFAFLTDGKGVFYKCVEGRVIATKPRPGSPSPPKQTPKQALKKNPNKPGFWDTYGGGIGVLAFVGLFVVGVTKFELGKK